ncbi:unnamed protein product [Prunus armeniaca]|uniref:F-box domain-containing protein n=1 Tax=Prunus armeniaca TaxID=36596 RepID=A0A6J5VVP4_PRUAR|nr:unnamed protein product [Prunus armeniaca]
MARETKGNPMNPRKKVATRAAMSSKNKEQSGEQCQPKAPCSKFQQLPQALVLEILSSVSIKTLLNCRCVCKDWLSIISDPQFTKLHSSRSPVGILIKTYPPIRKSRKLDFTHIEDCAGSDLLLEKIRFNPQNSLPIGAMPEFRLINSCNGLLCLSGPNRDYPCFVCNPILGEHISIPPTNLSRNKCFFVGLGFSNGTNEYKLLQMTNGTEAEIYTIGTGVWRSVGNAPGDIDQLPFNPFLHGALHWVSYSSTVPDFIHSFHFEREQFRPLPVPSLLGNRFSDCYILEVVGGCLCLSVFDDDYSKFDMWVMKEYGVQESWTKVLVFGNLYECPEERICHVYEPIMFLRNGEILLLFNNCAVVCYNQETKSFREIRITWTRSPFEAIAYSPSFVSLYNVSKGEEVKRVRRGKKLGKKSGKLLLEGSYDECAGFGMPPRKSTKLNSGYGCPAFEEGLP